jgi:hypothetical protein
MAPKMEIVPIIVGMQENGPPNGDYAYCCRHAVK